MEVMESAQKPSANQIGAQARRHSVLLKADSRLGRTEEPCRAAQPQTGE